MISVAEKNDFRLGVIFAAIIFIASNSPMAIANESNESVRKQQNFVVAASPFLPASGLMLGKRLSEANTIEAEGGGDLLSYYSYGSLHLKHFWGDSFYTNFGIGYSSGFESNRSGYGPNFALGNEWAWEGGVLLGCDWLGVDVPVLAVRNFVAGRTAYSFALRIRIGYAW